MSSEKLKVGLASDLNNELDVWQPMQTAPKDKQILIWDKLNECFYIARWSKKDNFWFVGAFEYIADETRGLWRELPSKPINI